MSAVAQRLEFAPVQPPGMVRSLALALLAHALLLAALTWGVNWRRDDSHHLAVEAELWSALPQQAAPPPPPPQEETPEPPAPVVKPPPMTPVEDPNIVLERERKKQELLRQEQMAQEREKKAAEDKRRKEELTRKQEADKREREKAQAAAKALEKQRQENLRRLAGLAGATGSPNATGSALQSSGPSAGYAARVRARVKPNIVFTEDVAGNPSAEVEVRTAPDGTIVGRKLVKSSGVKSWDDAVLKAIDKTEILPRDVDGRVHPSLIIVFRPKD